MSLIWARSNKGLGDYLNNSRDAIDMYQVKLDCFRWCHFNIQPCNLIDDWPLWHHRQQWTYISALARNNEEIWDFMLTLSNAVKMASITSSHQQIEDIHSLKCCSRLPKNIELTTYCLQETISFAPASVSFCSTLTQVYTWLCKTALSTLCCPNFGSVRATIANYYI